MTIQPAKIGKPDANGQPVATGLTLSSVVRRFGTLPAVDGVSLSVSAGEVVCLLGPSGCGKTTTLRIAAGLEPLDSGAVWINGGQVDGPQAFIPPERRSVGLMFQDYALFPHLTVAGNVGFGLTALSASERKARVGDALARVGLTRYADAYPHVLSGGEQQRVALARALAPQPGVVLMDEPFSGLDKRLRDAVRADTLQILHETGAAVLMVTHEPDEAMLLADRICLMRAGKVVQEGPPGDLHDRPVDIEAARFFSEINLLPGTVRDGLVSTVAGSIPAPAGPPPAVQVGVRPHGFDLDPAGQGWRVRQARYVGYESVVILDGPDGLVTTVHVAGQHTLVQGQGAGLAIRPDAAMIFGAQGVRIA